MATTTTNYNLTKPALTDSPPDITALNDNWDTLDTQLKNVSDKADTNESNITSITNNYVPKPAGGSFTTGNVAVFDSSGNCVDGGLKFTIVDGILRITY